MKINTHVTIKTDTDNTGVTMKNRIYNWIKYLCTNHNCTQLTNIPVVFTRECVASKFSISIRQVMRHLKSLEDDNKIYMYKLYNNITIYSLEPLDLSHDLFIRVRP